MTAACSTLGGNFGGTNPLPLAFTPQSLAFPSGNAVAAPVCRIAAHLLCPPALLWPSWQEHSAVQGFPAPPQAACSETVLDLPRLEEHCLQCFLHLDGVVCGERTENPSCLAMSKGGAPSGPAQGGMQSGCMMGTMQGKGPQCRRLRC